MNKTIKLSLTATLLVSSLQAQETIELKPLTITSTAIKTDELRATEAVEIYTAQDIQKAHVQNVYEFLGKNTSVFTTSAYGNPFTQKIDMRGYGVNDGYQNIVVTLNGRRMNNIAMVPQLLASISPSSIEKIEIIKSSGIVVGGDGANAGVINITTKKSNDKEITLSGGTYGAFDGAFYIGSSNEKLSVSLSGEAQKNNGTRHIDNSSQKDENKFSTFNFDIAYKMSKDLELRLNASTTSTDVTYAGTMTQSEYNSNPTQTGTVDYGWGPMATSSTTQKFSSNAISLGATYNINENLSLNFDMSKEKKESEFVTYASIYDYDYESAKISLDFDSETFSLTAGVDAFNGNMVKESSAIYLEKKNIAGFIMGQFELNNLTLKAGYRYENIDFKNAAGENEDESLSGIELGANYMLDKQKSLFANYSRSYQSSSLDRLFSFFSGSYTGYVEPSIANNYEVGFSCIKPNNKLKVSLFYVNLEDEIYYYADPTYMNSKNTNIDKSHKYGLDLYDKFIVSDELNIVFNYHYVKAIIDTEVENGEDYSNSDLPGVSDHNVQLTLNYMPNNNTTLALTQVYRSEAYAANDFKNNFSQKQDAYSATDVSATYSQKGYEVFAKINNLFNQKNGIWIKDDAVYPVNYTTTAIVGLKLKY